MRLADTNKTKTCLQVFVLLLLAPLCNNGLAATADGRWHAGIGDPTVFGWMTVALYGIVAIRCLYKAYGSHRYGGNYPYWLLLASFFLLLGINKQLDLQTWLTQTLRDVSIQHGWYEQRRGVQFSFIVVLGLGMLMVLISLRMFLMSAWSKYKLLWMGLALLCAFILIRAASFHHVDLAIGRTLFGVKMNVIIELSALCMILIGTYSKQTVSVFKTAKLSGINQIVQIEKAGDTARCPQCGKQSVATTVHDRKFKCRRCGFFFKVHVSGQALT